MPYLLRTITKTFLLVLPLTCVLAQATGDATERFKRGEEYLQSSNWKEAIREFESAIALKPDWAEAYFNLGMAHSKCPHTDQDKSKHDRAAMTAFETTVRLKPTWAEAHNELGERYRASGQSEQAVKAFEQAIRLKPDFADAHLNLGIAHVYKGRYKEGLKSLNESVRIEPGLARAHNLIGLTYLAMEERDKAMQEYDRLKTIDPEIANSLLAAIQRPEKFRFGVVQGKPIHRPKPEYPPEARAKRLSGRIAVEIAINEEGIVTEARALNGPMELQRAAAAAALKARFTPTRLSGKAVAVKGLIYYDFAPQ